MNSNHRTTRRVQQWSTGAALAATAAVLGMGTARADTPRLSVRSAASATMTLSSPNPSNWGCKGVPQEAVPFL